MLRTLRWLRLISLVIVLLLVAPTLSLYTSLGVMYVWINATIPIWRALTREQREEREHNQFIIDMVNENDTINDMADFVDRRDQRQPLGGPGNPPPHYGGRPGFLHFQGVTMGSPSRRKLEAGKKSSSDSQSEGKKR